MDQQLSERGLSLRPFDPEVFARVWSRVMPDQALSPIQPALPALRSPAQTAPAPSCLGEGSARYVPQLEALMDQLHAALGSVRQLARRGGGRASRLLASLAADQQRQLRRLSAAYFLITGRLYAPRDRVCTSGLTPRGPRRRHSRAEMRLPSATKGAGSCPVPISTAPDTVPGHRIR